MNAWHAAFRCLQEGDTSQTAPESETLLSSHYSCWTKPSTLILSTFRDSTAPPPRDWSCSDPAQYHFKIYQVPGYLYTQPRARIQMKKLCWFPAPKNDGGCATDRHRYEDRQKTAGAWTHLKDFYSWSYINQRKTSTYLNLSHNIVNRSLCPKSITPRFAWLLPGSQDQWLQYTSQSFQPQL